MSLKAAIFDMDGTLINSLIIWDVIWSKFGERYLGNPDFRVSEQVDREVRTMTLYDAMCYVHNEYNIGKSGGELWEFTNEILEDFYRNTVECKKGVKEFLEHCRKKGVKMCIASASDVDLIRVAFERCGIGEYFCKIFTCTDYGRGKEHPDVYLAALEYLGEDVCDTWVFEDSAVAICTADKIGMPTVGIYDKFNYGQDVIEGVSRYYIAENDSMTDLIGKII